MSIPSDVAKDLNDMHRKFGFHDHKFDAKKLHHRVNFLKEEHGELIEAYENNDPEKFIDAIIDSIVVGIGTLDLAGVSFWKSWASVHSANMSKELGFNPSRPDSDGIDLIKPSGWNAPSHLGNHGVLSDAFLEKSINDEICKETQNSVDEKLINSNSRFSVAVLKDLAKSTVSVNGEVDLKKYVSYLHTRISDVRGTLQEAQQHKFGTFDFNKFVQLVEKITREMIQVSADAASNLLGISVKDVYFKCCLLQSKKANDYQNSESKVTQASYYSWNGIYDNYYMIHIKATRLKSLVESDVASTFESRADTIMDIINYLSFAVSWLNGKMEGQSDKFDIFLRMKE